MALPTALYDHGTFTDSPCSQEANLLIDSVKAKSSRTEKYWMDIVTKADVLGRDSNPQLVWSISGWVKAVAGFVTQVPGTVVTTLANFSSTFRGFDPTVGLLKFWDPEDDWAMDDIRKLSFSVHHKPFIA